MSQDCQDDNLPETLPKGDGKSTSREPRVEGREPIPGGT